MQLSPEISLQDGLQSDVKVQSHDDNIVKPRPSAPRTVMVYVLQGLPNADLKRAIRSTPPYAKCGNYVIVASSARGGRALVSSF
jgi:hypothetical protein